MTSILIVEDDNDINNLICNTLKAEGYQCERAFDGKEGADKIEPVSYTHLAHRKHEQPLQVQLRSPHLYEPME